MTKEFENPVGHLFTHVYLERGKSLSDHELARNRIGAYADYHFDNFQSELVKFLRRETGLSVPWRNGRWRFQKHFSSIDICLVLNSITLIYRFLRENQCVYTHTGWTYAVAEDWKTFVARVFLEENLGYVLDDHAGVHYFVDEEFERNRHSALKCLEGPRYKAVQDAFEKAYEYITKDPRDTKAAVRSIFESLEILTRMMIETNNLNRSLVVKCLAPKALEVYGDDKTAEESLSKVFEGFSWWVDAMHLYRHGQKTSEPVAPPLEYAIYIVSSGAAYLRLLVEIDRKSNANNGFNPDV